MNGKIISGPAAVLIIALFFLPWIAVSCDGTPVGEFSGYHLAAGTSPDESEDIFAENKLNGDPILFTVPLAGIITLVLLAITIWKGDFAQNAGWGQIIISFIVMLILLLEWFQLRGESNGLFEMLIKPALWGTIVCLVAIGASAVFDLVQLGKRPLSTSPPQKKEKRTFQPTLIASHQDFAAQTGDDNHTILDDGLIEMNEQNEPIDLGATMLDDALSDVDDMNATILDNSLLHDVLSNVDDVNATILDNSLTTGEETPASQLKAPPVSPIEQGHPSMSTSPSQDRSIQKTEVLHFQTETEAWLVIDNGDRQGEQLRLLTITTIGRDLSNDLVLDDTALSGTHARIMGEDGRFFIIDQNSTNGIFIFDTSQNRWEKQAGYELQDGTQIKLGRTVLHFKSSI